MVTLRIDRARRSPPSRTRSSFPSTCGWGVILGKTQPERVGQFRSTRSTSEWSSRGADEKPYVIDRNPCGSSSGTGSAIAAICPPSGVGTETDGSIICPASVNGLVGIKPTVGLVSRRGIIPISASQDTAGPMARTVADAALLLTALAAVDEQDSAGAAAAGRIPPDYANGLDAGAPMANDLACGAG